MILLPRKWLIKTGPVDHADWNYRPVLGYIMRRRFHLVRKMLAGNRYERLLEIGYGSGVLLPELAAHCDQLYGVDVHPYADAVAQAVGQIAARPQLAAGSATSLPYESSYFTCVVAVSAMEFIDDAEAACREVRRVLAPQGTFAVVTPGYSAFVDGGLWLLTGESAKADYGDRRRLLARALLAHFTPLGHYTYPCLAPPGMKLYHGWKLRPLREHDE
jgi:SAM-dependent methyltransferase